MSIKNPRPQKVNPLFTFFPLSSKTLGRKDMSKKYRLITRSDLDGIVCASLLKEARHDRGDPVRSTPRTCRDGVIKASPNDILTNLPYHPEAHLVSLRPPRERKRAREGCAQEHSHQRPHRAQRRFRHLPPLRRRGKIPQHHARADGCNQPHRLRQAHDERYSQPRRLGDARLPHGQPHGAGPLPRLPHFQLPADDVAGRHPA